MKSRRAALRSERRQYPKVRKSWLMVEVEVEVEVERYEGREVRGGVVPRVEVAGMDGCSHASLNETSPHLVGN
jgi:hypothetical protein